MTKILGQLQYLLASDVRLEHLESFLIKSANPSEFGSITLETEFQLLFLLKRLNSLERTRAILSSSNLSQINLRELNEDQTQIIL